MSCLKCSTWNLVICHLLSFISPPPPCICCITCFFCAACSFFLAWGGIWADCWGEAAVQRRGHCPCSSPASPKQFCVFNRPNHCIPFVLQSLIVYLILVSSCGRKLIFSFIHNRNFQWTSNYAAIICLFLDVFLSIWNYNVLSCEVDYYYFFNFCLNWLLEVVWIYPLSIFKEAISILLVMSSVLRSKLMLKEW